MSDMTPKDFHVQYGRHSNIPDCCIEFFVGPWQAIWGDAEKNEEYSAKHRWVGYVPCPKCVRRKTFVQVHCCTTTCNPLLRMLGLETRTMRDDVLQGVLR